MAKETIGKILLAEEEGAQLVSNAQLKAKELLKEADDMIKANDVKTMEEARQEAEQLKNDAKLKAEQSIQGVLEEGKAVVNSILNTTDAEVDKAATAILERIVK